MKISSADEQQRGSCRAMSASRGRWSTRSWRASTPPPAAARPAAERRAFGHDGARRGRSGWSGRNRATGEAKRRLADARRRGRPEPSTPAARRRRRSRRCAAKGGWAAKSVARRPARESKGRRRAERVGQRAQDRPVLAGLARREGGAVGHLHPALGVHVEAGLLGVGGARQDHVGAVRAAVAVACPDRRRRRPARCRSRRRRAGTARRARPAAAIAGDVQAALARHEAEVEAADARRRRCAARRSRSSRPSTAPTPSASAPAQDGGAVGAGEGALPDDDQRALAPCSTSTKPCSAASSASVSGPAPR